MRPDDAPPPRPCGGTGAGGNIAGGRQTHGTPHDPNTCVTCNPLLGTIPQRVKTLGPVLRRRASAGTQPSPITLAGQIIAGGEIACEEIARELVDILGGPGAVPLERHLWIAIAREGTQ